MANYSYPYSNALNPMNNQFQQLQQMFPQPQGSVYSINSPLEIGNVPIGSTGLSVALCLNEGLMYIKSFQNGAPVIMTYKILPHNSDQKSTQTAPEVSAQMVGSISSEDIEELKTRITKLESAMNHQGGKFDELL